MQIPRAAGNPRNNFMKPIIILEPDSISLEDIAILRGNDLCVVVAKNPASVKFVDPIPAASCRTQMEQACISLSRILLNGQYIPEHKHNFAAKYIECLMKGTPLDPNHRSQEDWDKSVYDQARLDEISKMAREEARAEKAAKLKTK